MNAPDAENILGNEAAGHTSQAKIADAWAPYESKLVKKQIAKDCYRH